MPVLMSLYYSHHASFSEESYIPHTDHREDVLKHFACGIGENLLSHCGAYLVLELVRTCVYLIL